MSLVLMITGPAGAGKSTIGAGWAARGDTPRALIDADRLRTHIRAGFAHPDQGWTDETRRQWDIATELWQSMARIYRHHEIDCMIDLYAPPCPDPMIDAARAELEILRIVLLPDLDSCLERNRARPQRSRMADGHIRDNYAGFAACVRDHRPDQVIDNSVLTPELTVDAIETIIARR